MEPEIPRNKSGPGSQVDFFLWLLHGGNVSSNHNFYPINVKYQSLVFYSNPYTGATSDELKTFSENSCKLLGGACPIIPVIDQKTGQKIAYLPPLVFVFIKNDAPNIQAESGLYHYRIFQTETSSLFEPKKTSCESEKTTILNYNICLKLFGDRSPITYSMLFSQINNYCKNKNINPEDAVTGIFSCQTKMNDYLKNYNQTDIISSYVPRRMVNTLEQSKIFNYNDFFNNSKTLYATPCIVPAYKKEWKPLASLKHQGCALNVLSYYGLIEENTARENAVCLNIQGTSIYTIVDYINKLAVNMGNVNDGYMICRLPFLYGINLLYLFLFKLSLYGQNCACIFKLYNESHKNDKLSQMGHTISLFKDTTRGQIFLIDPQQNFDKLINVPVDDINKNSLNENNLNSYSVIYNFFRANQYMQNEIDIIFTVVDNNEAFPSINRLYFTKENLANQVLGPVDRQTERFIDRDTSINYGGYNIKKTQKNKIRIKKSKSNKNKKITKSNKNKKNKKITKNKKNIVKKYKGGGEEELDNFEKMMTQIDEKSGIETAIVIPSSECNIP
jgi:hypothetical protein